ncbi:ABC transporter ATP-binding protein [Stratiformator vulcanicus]|uniref:Teichoic acids export ATP-binding protein TagH n=1 Tax=Stratiformator vulcanicus TaxID=2527980 RepID=A0A517QXP8_9PLAN|nr:ABC transporter ATP-binding protein [Stratiformator vulcanicus]QDT36373.1 Teichoic acids export ATP-binding protein TagH [Stratiformator vulcanicus]
MRQINLSNAKLTFDVYDDKSFSFKQAFISWMLRRPQPRRRRIEAIKDVTLSIVEGERVGIIGNNGSGKSTILRMMAGVYPPTAGRCEIDGNVNALFDFSLGFEQNATGRDNVYYRGYLQGQSPSSIRNHIDEIIEFSELDEFIDIPIRCYSAGMLVRLGFAISTAVDPDILLIDECLAAGDASFQAKAAARMDEMISRAQLIVLVSHDLGAIERLCTRVVWMERGNVVLDGPAADVIAAYQDENKFTAAPMPEAA